MGLPSTASQTREQVGILDRVLGRLGVALDRVFVLDVGSRSWCVASRAGGCARSVARSIT
jgi:hypothetical protein